MSRTGSAETKRVPAKVGDRIADVDTPSLIVDLDVLERNLASMTAAVRGHGVRLRPHAKSHKCPEIAKLQMTRGAVGVCCQKVGEAEAFVAAGIGDLLGDPQRDRGREQARPPRGSCALGENRCAGRRWWQRRGACGCRASRRNHDRSAGRDRRRRSSLWRGPRRASARARARHRRARGTQVWRPARISGRGPASAKAARTARGDRSCERPCARYQGADRRRGDTVPDSDRRGYGNIPPRVQQRRVHGIAAGLVHLHGRRLRPQ